MRRALIATVFVVLIAGCGDSSETNGGTEGSAQACASDAVVIKMANIKFDPAKASAKVGQAICWENDDTVDHNAVANSGASFQSELFGKGQTFTTKVDQAGTVKYECTVHPGMTGEITVK
jgi:plastocyanin